MLIKRISVICVLLMLLPLWCYPARCEYNNLKEIILGYFETKENNFPFRGEAGLLGMPPNVAKSFGMKVYMDKDYKEARRLFKRAEESLDKAKEYLNTQEKESYPDEFAIKAGNMFLAYKDLSERAKALMKRYISKINEKNDERFNREKSLLIMDKILEICVKANENRLRDSLGMFYNLSKGLEPSPTLNVQNIMFVNHVFNKFTKTGGSEVNEFDLDRVETSTHNNNWKSVIDKKIFPYTQLIENLLNELDIDTSHVDPLLFVSLIKKESSFDQFAVSSVGAAGLTQIMPHTAKALGMEHIHIPDYYLKACRLLKKERELKRRAINTLYQINQSNKIRVARHARSLMQDSIRMKRLRKSLFLRYKKELIQAKTDQRLMPDKAIRYGLIYFSRLLKIHNGDISLALAAYNAGPGRVKEYQGIPPFEETIDFRNRVLKYYREYRELLND